MTGTQEAGGHSGCCSSPGLMQKICMKHRVIWCASLAAIGHGKEEWVSVYMKHTVSAYKNAIRCHLACR
jgi:hypothetical protein